MINLLYSDYVNWTDDMYINLMSTCIKFRYDHLNSDKSWLLKKCQ